MRERKRKPMKAVIIVLYLAVAAGLVYSVHPFVHALGRKTVTLEIGEEAASVKATLAENGTLTISGKGRTRDYTEETAPFVEYADRITAVKIQEGVTSIGDYLFYNCGNLKGRLVIPSSVIWIGDGAFSGEDQEHAPKFSVVESAFTEREIAFLKPGYEKPQESGNAPSEATPGNASGGPGETTGAETAPTSTETAAGPGETTGSAVPPTEIGPGPGETEDATVPSTEIGQGETAGETVPSAENETTGAATPPTESETTGAATPPTENETTGAATPPTENETTDAATPPAESETTEKTLSMAKGKSPEASQETGEFSVSSSLNSRGIRTFSLNTLEEPEAEAESAHDTQGSSENSEPVTEPATEGNEKEETAPDRESRPQPASSSDAQEQEESDDNEETEPTEEYSEDGTLSNDLYENAVDAVEVDESQREYYTFEIITSQIIGTEIFYSGQTGIYECEMENTAFIDAAEQAGYRKADRFIEVDMEGIRESMPVIDGMLYAPELPEEFPVPEDDGEPLFVDSFSGWIPESEWEEAGYEASVYPPGSTIAVGDETESIRLFGNWEKAFRITTEIQVHPQNELTIYTLADSETGQPIPRSEGYEIDYQWQVCGPEEGQETWEDQEAEAAAAQEDQNAEKNETLENEPSAAGDLQKTADGETSIEESVNPAEIIQDEGNSVDIIEEVIDQDDMIEAPLIEATSQDDTVWRDIESANEAIYQRISDPMDTERYFRVQITARKISRFRSASEPVVIYSDPVQGEKELVKVAVSYVAGDGATGTPPESRTIDSGETLSPSRNTFTRAADDGKVFTGWLLTLNGVTAAKPSGVTVGNGTIVEANDVALKLTAQAGADAPSVTFTAQWNTATVIYVSTSVSQSGTGTKDSPVKTLAEAYAKLPENGSAKTNVVELLTNYTLSDKYWENIDYRRNVTIRGQGKETTKVAVSGDRWQQGELIIDNLTLACNAEVYFVCCGYNVTFNENSAVSNTKTFNSDNGLGVPGGTPQTHLIAGHKGAFPDEAIYGSHGTNVDDPIRIVSSDQNVVIGRMACEGWNMSGHTSTKESPIYVEATLNNGSVGLFAFGGITGQDVYMHSVLNMNGGSIYLIAGGNHSDGNCTMEGSIKLNMTGGHITTLNGGPMGRFYSDITHTKADINIDISGGEVDTIYMGGSTGTVVGNLTANISGGTIGRYYGGGCGKSDFIYNNGYREGSAYITGNVTTNISGGTITGNVYAGGCGSNLGKGSGVINGNTSLTISGDADIKNNVYGGGEGVTADATAGNILGDSTVTISGGTIGGNLYGGGGIGSVHGKVTVNILPGTNIQGTVFGGGDTSGSVGSTAVNISAPYGTEAAPKNIYGAGNGSNTSVTGEASVHVSVGADIHGNVFGGGEAGSAGATKILLQGGTVTGDVFGGGNKAEVKGTVSIEQKKDSQVIGGIYGGSNSEKAVKGQASIEIAGHVTNVYGGGLGINTSVEGGTKLTISEGALISQNVYGGGQLGSINESLITLQGGTVSGNVFGSGNEVGAPKTVIQVPSAADVKGSIYGGSNEKGETTETNINVLGNFTGSIFGGGYGENTKVKNSKITVLSGAKPTGTLYGGGEKGETENSQILVSNGGSAADMFGGGLAADVTVSSLLTVESGAEAGQIYGGSNQSGSVTGAQLAISGAVTYAYGGGRGALTTTKAPVVTAESGSKITELYGGGQEGKTVNGTTIHLKNGSRADQVFGGGHDAGIEGIATIQMDDGSRAWKVYGGSNSSGTVAETSLTINGTVGGNGTTGTAEGPGAVYGGGQGEQTSTGKAEVEIGSTALVTGEVFGGGAKGPVTGDTKVVLKTSGHAGKSQINGNVYAGGDAATVGGSTRLEANDGAVIAGSLYGGGKGKTAVIGTDTRVLAFAHVTGNVFGGGAEGDVTGNTHVDIAKGTIDGDGVNTGNVFGGSDRSYVVGNTQVHIGVEAATGTDTDVTGASLIIAGSVFGGGNTTDTGSNFDASDPFVKGTATVKIDATDYEVARFNIGKSILGDGNMCTVKGSRTVTIKGYQAVESQANTSIQRADTLILEKSRVELTGAVDSANLVPTIAYSLNRIDHLIMKGGSTLRLQAPVNLVKELVSQDAAGDRVTTTATTEIAAKPSTENHIDIQQGVQMELRTSEDVTTMEYGAVSGFMILDVYDPDASKEIESGIYVLGNYVTDESLGGFLYGSGESQYKRIDPSTDEANWRNWAIGTNMKKTVIMVMSDKPAGGKIVEMTSPWPADGSVYRLVQNTSEDTPVTIKNSLMDGSKFVLKDPAALGSGDPIDTTLGISIQAGNQGWVNPMTMGYIAGDSLNGAKEGGYGGLAKEPLQTLNNRAINPTILVELTNLGGISKTDDDYPLTVTFQLENVKMLSDGGYSLQGTLSVELQIRRESMETYDDVLISTGKEYVRAIQSYTFATAGGDTGATISQKSAVTLQYGKKENGGVAASDHKLSFSVGDTPTSAGTTDRLPAGVTILAVDRSGNDPIYAHYTVPAGGISEVKLSQFIKNGSNESYTHSLSYYDRENYLFILDFANAPADYSREKLCVTFEPIYSAGSSAVVKPAKILLSIASGQPGYKLSSPEATGADKEGASYDRKAVLPLTLITYAAGGSGGVDTTGTNMEMGVRLRLKNRDVGTYVPVPTDWIVEMEGKETGELAGGGISVTLGSSMMSSTSSLGINMKPASLSAGKYQWEIYLTSSSLAAYPGSLTGTPLYLNFNIMDKRYSIEAAYKDPSASRLYPSVSPEARLPLEIRIQSKLENGAASDGLVERASLWKKDQTTGEYTSIDFGTLFDGVSGTSMDYDWQASRDISYMLKTTLPEGTYRLKYELIQTGSGTDQLLTQDTENFIVTP